MIAAIVILVLIAYAAFHLGHGHANYRHQRAHGRRGVSVYWNSAIPGPFGTRIGHRL